VGFSLYLDRSPEIRLRHILCDIQRSNLFEPRLIKLCIVNRPSPDTVESLRITLHKLELTLDPVQDAGAMAELKRVILLRIAELDAVRLPTDDVA
jgi:hypothetical protein